jgi:hypothetical protein
LLCSSSIELNGLCSHTIKKNILSQLTVILDILFIKPHGNIKFSLPQGGNQFFFCLHSDNLFGLAAKPRGDQWQVCLYDCHISTACLPFLGSLIPNSHSLAMNATPHGDIDFLFASRQMLIIIPP